MANNNDQSSATGAPSRQVARQIRQARGHSTGRPDATNANHQGALFRSPIRPGMASSRFATFTSEDPSEPAPDPMDIDPMEIDSPPPQQAQPAPTTTLTRMNEQAQNSGMHRHKFYLSIGPRPMPTLDLDVLTVARAEVTRLRRAGLPVLESLPERSGPHLYIRIDTDQASRDQALARADLRMGIMQDMIRDGFGWFSGLPYRHPHFDVKFLRSPRL
ncbi:uncharacterized protein N7518_002670 [Penicillium psychrosexuale]|uniref:uncharacterized protein n=1 Tax=Penicillium psychrosexuale TaxID=1002107 RepID=UPI0025459885|nr:uncharacterized protein N7518_002670 [Penicillium psychrosexuale]KAJ5800602.1 hypothetical protein N7518_002670 [Penicillium psychrosexuale]